MSEESTLEERSEQKGEDRQVAIRLSEIKLARKTEADWRKDAEVALTTYRSQKKVADDLERKDSFNILWANTEIKRQAVYNNVPRADIRKRYDRRDPLAKAVSEMLEKCVEYAMDCGDTDRTLIAAVNDMLLPGRAITRVKYEVKFDTDEDEKGEEVETDRKSGEKVLPEQVQWDDFVRGPGRTWKEVTWIAFEHRLEKSEVKKRFPEFADQLDYNYSAAGEGADLDKTDDRVFKQAVVFELWDKSDRKVYWIAQSYKDSFLDVQDDPLELVNFWPIPEPMRAIEDSSSLIPITEYSQYIILAKELELICKRRTKIIDALRVRGVYDSTIAEMSKVFESSDNDFIPAENLSRLIESGGLEKAIWMLPIDRLIAVYQILGQQRADLVGQIYEITGISDIVRGNTNPNETLGAQQIKASYGNMRIDRQRSAVQKYARDLIRLMVEVMADKFSRETFSAMSGMNFPTQMEKAQAQQVVAVAQMQAQMNPQMAQQMQGQAAEAQKVLARPSWEDIESVLESDLMLEYRVDVETDSTIAADQQKEQQSMTEFMTGMGQFFKYASDGINSGMLTKKLADMTMAAIVRRFKLGRDIEDELDAGLEQPQQVNPAQQAQQQAQQQEAQAAQAKAQAEAQKQQFELQKMQIETQAKEREANIEAQLEHMKLQTEAQKVKLQEYEAMIEQSRLSMQAEYDQQAHKMKMQETIVTGMTNGDS